MDRPRKSQQLISYENIVNNAAFCDLACVCSDGAKVLVNKFNVALQCPALNAMLDSKMKESAANDVLIDDIDSKTFLALLRFIYCEDVDSIDGVAYSLLYAANKYGVDRLKSLCVASLMENLTIWNVCKIFKLADVLQEQQLLIRCIEFVKL